MLRLPGLLTAAAAALSLGAGAASAMPIGVSLGDNGRTLVTMFDIGAPADLIGVPLVGDAGFSRLTSLAHRPQTGQLYGFAQDDGSVYEVDRFTGAVSLVATTADSIAVEEVGFDFNNQIDAARLVSTAEDNLVFFVNNAPPNVARFTSLFYDAGDANEGQDPSIFANAYTNAVPDATSTTQFALDSANDSLVTLANNAGTLTTVGRIAVGGAPLNFVASGGFDILSPAEGSNLAYALLTTAVGTGLYSLDLATGLDGFVSATLLGMTGSEFGPLTGLAVFDAGGDAVQEVPVPASVLMLGAGLAGLGALRRRRARG